MSAILLGILLAFLWLIVLFASEFKQITLGYKSQWNIIQWLWNNSAWIRKIPW